MVKIVDENTLNERKDVNLKDQFEDILTKIKQMSEAIELHDNVKEAVDKKEVDYNYLRYIEKSLEEKLFENANVKEIMPKVLLEIICPGLVGIEEFDSSKLQIENIGSHFEEQENYIDKICLYNNKLICVFGISEMHPNKVLKYEPRKFSRVDMINAIKEYYKEGQKINLFQYDEYYICIEENNDLKVFSERKVTALVKVQETIFDKIKEKLSKIFAKKKKGIDLNIVYDSTRNRLLDINQSSKFDAKNRMKLLLNREREIINEQS